MILLSNFLEDDHREHRTTAGGEVVATYLHIVLENVIPSDLSKVSIDRLISFREEHRDELTSFHKHLQALGSTFHNVSDVADPAALRGHLQVVYERETRPLVADLRRALSSEGMDTVGRSLVLKIDISGLAGSALGATALAAGAPLSWLQRVQLQH